MAGELTELEMAIETLVKNYDKYASKGFCWRKHGIGKGNFQKMLSQELHHMLTNTESKQAVDKMRQSCDKNQDGQISFEEYWTLMGSIAKSLLFTMEEPEENTSK
ncbi:protein S100-A16-like [Eublepharis macularius]|uniref:Protein S100-A16-like n=1 Tax=Eublepharis macularius TaxID=481883 RepID=A0AA97JI21_EUBMA|nr:protein S100-A16-like [Eublepharis macularius]XP_054839179.1 protein S100-A16-like [Eublepharis macularius]